MQHRLAPGARVTIRDEDWVVRRLDLSDDGGHALTCDGLSELVRGTSAIFLERLEAGIQVHDPAETELFQDLSDYFTDTLLYLESQRLRTVANDGHIHRAHQAVMKSADSVTSTPSPSRPSPAFRTPKATASTTRRACCA
jgi:hypothetical protein